MGTCARGVFCGFCLVDSRIFFFNQMLKSLVEEMQAPNLGVWGLLYVIIIKLSKIITNKISTNPPATLFAMLMRTMPLAKWE